MSTDVGPVTTNVNRLVIVTGTVAIFVGSATLRAVTVTAAGDGRIPGAVKFPFASIVPHALDTQPVPATVQLTAALGFPALAICATKVCTAPSSTLALAGVTLTATSLVIVMGADALTAESAWLTACTIALAG